MSQDMQITADAMRALQKHELKVYYQPQYDAITGALRGAEALVRWHKPDGSVVLPGSFVPQLEDGDEILALDWYMLEGVCRFLNAQLKAGADPVPVSVNFSRKHVFEEDFIKHLCETVDRFSVPHEYIVAEITESAFVDQSQKIAEWIAQIRDRGFRVAIDDFGSGLSSLSFVKDISIDVLKIDKSLLTQADANACRPSPGNGVTTAYTAK